MCEQLGNAGDELRVNLPQLLRQRVALGRQPLAMARPLLVRLAALQLADARSEPLHGRLQPLGAEGGVLHLAASRGHLAGGTAGSSARWRAISAASRAADAAVSTFLISLDTLADVAPSPNAAAMRSSRSAGYGPPDRSAAQGDLCHEAPALPVTQTSRSSATRSIDNSLGGFFLHR